MTDSDSRERIRRVARDLSFDPSAETIEGVAESVAALRQSAEEPPQIERESRGHMGEDEFGAFLDCYVEPRTGSEDGPLAGLSFAIKDLLAVRDLRMTLGVEAFDYVPSFDAVAVERLLDAGASIVGKANTDAYAFGPTGEFSELRDVTNPAAPDRVPGGSSSGSAAAVRAGLVDAALGTDAGGSLRIPAACCGVVGVKPTNGLVPRFGLVGLAPSLSTIGPMTSDVPTAAETLDAIAGYHRRDPSSSRVDPGPIADFPDDEFVVGLPDYYYETASDTVSAAVRTAVDDLARHGNVSIQEVSFDPGEIESAFPFVMAGEVSWLLREHNVMRGIGTGYSGEWHGAFADLEAVGLNDHVASRILPVAVLDDETNGGTYVTAREEVYRFVDCLEAALEDADALILPTLRKLPPERGSIDEIEGADLWGNTGPFNAAEVPAVSLEVADDGGVPIAAQVIAPVFDDRTALTIAARWESALEAA